MMKKISLIIFALSVFFNLHGQQINDIISCDIEEAIPKVDRLLSAKKLDQYKLIGLGDPADFAKESKILNFHILAYLISRKNYRNVLLAMDDWRVRPLNAYLSSPHLLNPANLDSVFRSSISEYMFYNQEFLTFVTWLEKFNADNPDQMVRIFGIEQNTEIPPSYFLATYIFPVDETHGRELARKWSNSDTPDSLAFLDIETWFAGIVSSGIPEDYRDLIEQCRNDINHNRSFPDVPMNQKLTQGIIENSSKYVAGRIIDKLDKKSVLVGGNAVVVKANILSTIVADGLPVSSVGNYLDKYLTDDYCVFVTDFVESAELYVIDIPNSQIVSQEFTGTDYTKRLYTHGDHFDSKRDRTLLKEYRPIILSLVKDRSSIVSAEEDDPIIDLLFLLPNLTPSSML